MKALYLQGADAISTGRILETIVRMCFEAGRYDLLNENVIQLTKKRGQLKQVLSSPHYAVVETY